MLDQLVLIAAVGMPGACGFLSRDRVSHTLHWHVTAARESAYHLPQTSGSICTYEADEGTVLVTVPDHGSSFLQNNDLVDPFKNQLGLRVTGLGASAEMFDNTAYLSKHGQGVSVAILPTEGTADVGSLSALAKIVASRMP